jgi:hypothetical protein
VNREHELIARLTTTAIKQCVPAGVFNRSTACFLPGAFLD